MTQKGKVPPPTGRSVVGLGECLPHWADAFLTHLAKIFGRWCIVLQLQGGGGEGKFNVTEAFTATISMELVYPVYCP